MGKDERSSGETHAHNFSSRQKTDRGGAKGKVGEDTGGEEEIGGGLKPTVKRLLLPLYFVSIISCRSVNAAKNSSSASLCHVRLSV
jgi:hypothetical protein